MRITERMLEEHIPEELSGVEFVHHEGADSGTWFLLFGLTTCGFCRKAVGFLEEHDIAFSYVYVNTLPPEKRQKITSYVEKAFDRKITYPFLSIDGKRWISGFLRIEWERLIGL